jgi:hypothetical protein
MVIPPKFKLWCVFVRVGYLYSIHASIWFQFALIALVFYLCKMILFSTRINELLLVRAFENSHFFFLVEFKECVLSLHSIAKSRIDKFLSLILLTNLVSVVMNQESLTHEFKKIVHKVVIPLLITIVNLNFYFNYLATNNLSLILAYALTSV